MLRGLGVGQRPQDAVRLLRASEPQESPSALDHSLVLPLLLGESRRGSIPPVPSPCDLAKSVTLPSSSFVSFTVTGKTRFKLRSP